MLPWQESQLNLKNQYVYSLYLLKLLRLSKMYVHDHSEIIYFQYLVITIFCFILQ